MAWTWVDAAGVTHNTPVCFIDAAGIHRPALADCLVYMTDGYKSIYGSDTYMGADSQDGEWAGIQAKAIDDVNAAVVSSYNSFRPSFAQGAGLASLVKLNGMTKKVASFSSVSVNVVGVQFTKIVNGLWADAANNVWALPATVVIPPAGVISVTATCQTVGAVAIGLGVKGAIKTQTRGWQSVTTDITNPVSLGAPVELDAQLRVRQATSTAQPSITVLDGIVGAILQLPGVITCRGYENDDDVPDINGLPGHAISLVVEGGDQAAIAAIILKKKVPGGNTFGNTIVQVPDAYGIPRQIAFFIPTQVGIFWSLNIRALTGYTVDIGASIQQSLTNWTNALGTGSSIIANRANVPANLYGAAASATYEIVSLKVARANSAAQAGDIAIGFTEEPICPVVTNADGTLSYPNVSISLVP